RCRAPCIGSRGVDAWVVSLSSLTHPCFFLSLHTSHRSLHSFPPRRSSDLCTASFHLQEHSGATRGSSHPVTYAVSISAHWPRPRGSSRLQRASRRLQCRRRVVNGRKRSARVCGRRCAAS